MAPIPSTLISSGSRKKEPRCACLSEAKASHSHKMCTEVSSSVPHFLQVGLSLSPITCTCLLIVLCPVSRPIRALVCVVGPLWPDQGQRSIPEPASVHYRDLSWNPHGLSRPVMGLLYLYGLDCMILVQFLGAFKKLRKEVITFVTSVVFFLFGQFPGF